MAEAGEIFQKIKARLLGYLRRAAIFLSPTKRFKTLLYHLGFYKISRRSIAGINLGSSDIRIKGFLNIDASCFADADIVAGVENIKLGSGTVSVIYNSHVFEHLSRNVSLRVLREWYRVLKPSGHLYIAVPDLEKLFNKYLENINQYDKDENRRVADKICNIIYGGQVNKYDFHYYGYSFATLKYLLLNAGFKKVERFNASEVSFLSNITDGASSEISLNIRATK